MMLDWSKVTEADLYKLVPPAIAILMLFFSKLTSAAV